MSALDMAAYAEYVANPIVRSTAPRGAGLVISMGHVWQGGVIVFSGSTAECKAQYLALRYPARKVEVVAPVFKGFATPVVEVKLNRRWSRVKKLEVLARTAHTAWKEASPELNVWVRSGLRNEAITAVNTFEQASIAASAKDAKEAKKVAA